MGASAASVPTHVTDACQTSVEQAAATGVVAALAKGQAADHNSARPGPGPQLGHQEGGGAWDSEGVLKEAKEGRQRAQVEAAQLRVEVEALRRRGDDLQQRVGVAKAQVRSLTSTLSATFTAQHGRGPPGVQSHGSGSRSAIQ